MTEEIKETRHSATDPSKCEEMRRKYGWELIGYEENESSIFAVDCIFAGKAEFPKSRIDFTGDDDEDE